MSGSANDSIITPNGGGITDSAGNYFNITTSGTVDMNNAPLGYTANVIEGAYVNGNFWQENSSGLWWEYTGNPSAPWTGLGSSVSPLPTSPSGTVVTPGNGGFITDSKGDTFTLTSAGTVDMNNQPLGYTANVIEVAYVNGHVWQENSSGLWWEYQGNPSSPWTGLGTSANPLPHTLYWNGGNGAISLTDGQTLNLITTDNNNVDGYNPTINASGSVTVNISGTSYFEGSPTLNIAQGSDLKLTGTLAGYGLNVNGPGTLTNDGTIDGSWININTNVLGTGTFEFVHWGDGPGSNVIAGSSGSGLTYNVGGTMTIDDPNGFLSQVNLIQDWPGEQLNLVGLSATSYDLQNDMLTLYQGNSKVYSMKLSADSGVVVQDYAASGSAKGGVSVLFGYSQQQITGLPQHTVTS
jgi:hypothetical protein